MTTIEHNGHRIDETSQICLRVLRDRREPVTTGELRRDAGVEQNAQIRYRFDEHLIPANLAERGPDKPSPGKGPDAASWKITEEGIDWVDDHEQDIQDARDAAHVVDALRDTREAVDNLHEKVDEIEDRVETIQNRIHRTEGKTDSAVEAVDTQYNEASRRMARLESDVEDIEDYIDDLDDRLDHLVENVDEHKSRLRTVVSDVNNSFDDTTGEIERLDERLREVERRQEKSLLNRLTAWYRQG